MPKFSIDNHLLVPFACEKWRIQDIKVSQVSPTSTYFDSPIPLAYINKIQGKPLTLSQIGSVYQYGIDMVEFLDLDQHGKLDQIGNIIKTWTDNRSVFESKFIEVYFELLKDSVTRPESRRENKFCGWQDLPEIQIGDEVWGALLPLPQAHLYLENSLEKMSFFEPDAMMVKVDFLFWDGSSLLAVEVDGKSHVGDEKHVVRDRELKKSGVETYHILHPELIKYGYAVISRLLPDKISRFWNFTEGKTMHLPYD